MLGQRHRRWVSIKTVLVQYLVIGGPRYCPLAPVPLLVGSCSCCEYAAYLQQEQLPTSSATGASGTVVETAMYTSYDMCEFIV